MTHPNAFALANSDVNPFLHADVGTELNGSPLTVLSILARLGRDPWTEAARLAKLPRAEASQFLAQSIGKMPLDPAAVAGASVTAARLIKLLPAKTGHPTQSIGRATSTPLLRQWAMIALVGASLAFGLMANRVSTSQPQAAATTPIVQPTVMKTK